MQVSGKKLKLARETKSLTQSDLAKKIKVSDVLVSRWEKAVGDKGYRRVHPKHFDELAKALGVTIQDLCIPQTIYVSPRFQLALQRAAKKVGGDDALAERAGIPKGELAKLHDKSYLVTRDLQAISSEIVRKIAEAADMSIGDFIDDDFPTSHGQPDLTTRLATTPITPAFQSTLERACAKVGGPQVLADRAKIPLETVEAWLMPDAIGKQLAATAMECGQIMYRLGDASGIAIYKFFDHVDIEREVYADKDSYSTFTSTDPLLSIITNAWDDLPPATQNELIRIVQQAKLQT